MPIYTYACKTCGHTFDHLARTLNDAAQKCPKCGAKNPHKQLAAFATVAAPPTHAACNTCAAAPRCPHAGTCGLPR